MKKHLNFVLIAALAAGALGTAAAQNADSRGPSTSEQVVSTVFNPSQAGMLQQVDWRRCDGDHDRDDRGCYYRDRDGRAYYGNGYYGNSYYAAPYDSRPAGWYDRNGRWHAYDKDRDRDRRRHDDDDRR